MKAPGETINITDTRWQEIKDVCRRNGLDADKVTVKVNKNETPLRAELDRLAAMYIKHKNSKTPTERQLNAMVAEDLKKTEALRDRFRQDADGRYHSMLGFFASHDTKKQLFEALDALENDLRSNLVARPLEESNAAKRARDHYWFMLRQLWMKVAPHIRKRKPLADFLQAATDASTDQIKNYLDRLPRKASRIADYL